MKRSLSTLGAFGCALAVGLTLSHPVAAADSAKSDTQPKFESLDKDGNGKVSVNEAAEHDGLFVAFKQLDQDKDGELTREEFAKYQASR